jgi:hypothetical protein
LRSIRAASRRPILPPPAIMTFLTGRSMRRNSRITEGMSCLRARKNTSSPGSITVMPLGTMPRSRR